MLAEVATCDMVQLAMQVLLENDPNMALFSVDAANAFNAIERSALRAALVMARPELHPLLPLYDVYMLYTDCEGELWFCDDNGDYYETF